MNISRTWSFLDIPAVTAMASEPALMISSLTRLACPEFVSLTTTFAPFRANVLAITSPIPLPEPVIMATLFLIDIEQVPFHQHFSLHGKDVNPTVTSKFWTATSSLALLLAMANFR